MPSVRVTPRTALAGLAAVNSVSALAGSYGLVSGGIRLEASFLRRTPFDSWRAPGLILGAIVGGTSALGLVAAALGSDRQARGAGLLAGSTLVAWILVQVAMIGPVSILQPAYGGLGIAMIAASLRVRG